MSVAVLLSGCLQATVAESPGSTAQHASAAPTQSNPPDPPGSATGGGRPSPIPPPLPGGTDYRDRLGPYATYILGDSALVPWGSIEFLTWMQGCIESAGFDVTIDGGGLTVAFGNQEEAYREVQATCEQAAVDRGLVEERTPPDDEALAAFYDAYMLTYDCLVEHDYPVPDRPSKETYIESGHTRWHPYDALADWQVISVEKVCPQDLVILFEMLASGTKP